jgi:hypothetical protein
VITVTVYRIYINYSNRHCLAAQQRSNINERLQKKRIPNWVIAEAVPVYTHVTVNDVHENLTSMGVNMCIQSLRSRLRSYVDKGMLTREKGSPVNYTASKQQKELIVKYGEKLKEAQSKRAYVKVSQMRRTAHAKDATYLEWGETITGKPGSTVMMTAEI